MSAVETCNDIAQVIGENNVQFDLVENCIVSFCKHTPDFKENLMSVSNLLPKFNPSYEHNHGFKDSYVRCEKIGDLL